MTIWYEEDNWTPNRFYLVIDLDKIKSGKEEVIMKKLDITTLKYRKILQEFKGKFSGKDEGNRMFFENVNDAIDCCMFLNKNYLK